MAGKTDMQKWYQRAYINILINGILLLKMIDCSIQIYSGIFQQKGINTKVYVCDLAGLYHSKFHLFFFGFVQWLDGFGVSYRNSDAAATLQDVWDTGWGFWWVLFVVCLNGF